MQVNTIMEPPAGGIEVSLGGLMSDAGKIELRRANDNPWYCLATLHGEQPAQGLDHGLADNNRMAWNRWMAVVLSGQQRADLVSKGFSEEELEPLSASEQSAFCSDFASRVGREAEMPPDPAKVVEFAHTHFDRTAIFERFLFTGPAEFKSARFSSIADFTSATFSGEADFALATFCGWTSFTWAAFSGGASFGNTTFSEVALFGFAKFSVQACFSFAEFSKQVAFGEAEFYGEASFSRAKFFGPAGFKSATFWRRVYFNSTIFSGCSAHYVNADFVNAEFTETTVFADARFKSSVPDFRGAKMHDATEWHDVVWPPVPRNKDEAQVQVYAYERLKAEMERLKKHEDEQFFFRKEMRARRGLASFWSKTGLAWFLNAVYQVLSNYGQSVFLPVIWLFVLLAIGVPIFGGTPVWRGNCVAVIQAALISSANIFSFLPISREIMTHDVVDGLSRVVKLFSMAQSLLGVALLFLLGLALRNRFRMR